MRGEREEPSRFGVSRQNSNQLEKVGLSKNSRLDHADHSRPSLPARLIFKAVVKIFTK